MPRTDLGFGCALLAMLGFMFGWKWRPDITLYLHLFYSRTTLRSQTNLARATKRTKTFVDNTDSNASNMAPNLPFKVKLNQTIK